MFQIDTSKNLFTSHRSKACATPILANGEKIMVTVITFSHALIGNCDCESRSLSAELAEERPT